MAPASPAVTHGRIEKKKAISLKTSSTVALIVGNGRESFTVHKSLLASRLEFFKRMFNGPWKEQQSNSSTCLRTIRRLSKPGFTFAIPTNSRPLKTRVERRTITAEYILLAKIYVFCEKLQDTRAKNAVIRAIFDLTREKDKDNGRWRIPEHTAVRIIYDGTPKDSPARRLVVELMSNLEQTGYQNYCDDKLLEATDFWKDLALSLRNDRSQNSRNIAIDKGVTAYLEKESA
ncbi:hypothetical protein EJ04DRAFT_579392 [Polyplosphaeria fusca]|uniref:BTB domain-containing protein n=1 Tax=Polyplosphaeria fusca TaxID=682080 RepID=A0A9P4QP50_9PLEO|nr:hypothetical protein EJ04DRAFT_579392 [Polyplosphaeria fusca]